MGKRDYGHREPRKTKKDTKKVAPVSIVPTPLNVEVIKKGKHKEEETGE